MLSNLSLSMYTMTVNRRPAVGIGGGGLEMVAGGDSVEALLTNWIVVISHGGTVTRGAAVQHGLIVGLDFGATVVPGFGSWWVLVSVSRGGCSGDVGMVWCGLDFGAKQWPGVMTAGDQISGQKRAICHSREWRSSIDLELGEWHDDYHGSIQRLEIWKGRRR